jgi:hypothetical protein
VWIRSLVFKTTKGENMETTTATAEAAIAASAQPQPNTSVFRYNEDQLVQLVVALEEPFDPQEIKWRVTNTTSDRRRGHVIAYADPRAYTDRLNALFTVRGWTREYSIQVIQNFERMERGNSAARISGKIVVACKVTIDGLGAHSGLGEEWADNENAATAAEAQAFKRACACFGLGRYLYDLAGSWVDLDEKKQSLSKPKFPEWALPKRKSNRGTPGGSTNQNVSGGGPAESGSLDITAIRQRVRDLSGQVGFSLARSLTLAIVGGETAEGVHDVGVLATLVAKLEDTVRGVERLHAATAVVGQAKCSEVCRTLNFPGDSLDDIPDRAALRQLIESLEKEAGATPMRQHRDGAADAPEDSQGVSEPEQPARSFAPREMKSLGEARGKLLREAQRVARLKGLKLAEVVDRAAKGAFRFTDLQRLTPNAVPAIQAATQILQRVA